MLNVPLKVSAYQVIMKMVGKINTAGLIGENTGDKWHWKKRKWSSHAIDTVNTFRINGQSKSQ